MNELLLSRRVLLRRVPVPLHRPLGRQQALDTHRTSGMNPPGGDANFGSYRGVTTVRVNVVVRERSP